MLIVRPPRQFLANECKWNCNSTRLDLVCVDPLLAIFDRNAAQPRECHLDPVTEVVRLQVWHSRSRARLREGLGPSTLQLERLRLPLASSDRHLLELPARCMDVWVVRRTRCSVQLAVLQQALAQQFHFQLQCARLRDDGPG